MKEFRLFTFDVVINMLQLKSDTLLFAFYFYPLFFAPFPPYSCCFVD